VALCVWCIYAYSLLWGIEFWIGMQDRLPRQTYQRHRISNPLAPVPREVCVASCQQLSLIWDKNLQLGVGWKGKSKAGSFRCDWIAWGRTSCQLCLLCKALSLSVLCNQEKKMVYLNPFPLCNSNIFPSSFLLEVHFIETAKNLSTFTLKIFRKLECILMEN
jgi:hypothetical protein